MAVTGSSIGGVSAVNPQARGNYQQYIDAAYDNTKGRLDPIFEQQRNAYNQQMVNMGLPVGGEAYNKSFQQMDQNQNDAYSNASFGAMGFGLDAQNQDFNQDATRSGLANALLQSKWGTDLGYYNTDTNAALAREGLAEGGRQFDTGLAEGGRQFDSNLGYQYDTLGQQGEQFNADWLADLYRFDTGMDYNYFNADRDDMRWLTELDYGARNDQVNNNRWSDQLGQNYTQPYDPGQLDPSGAVIGANRNNMVNYGIQQNNNNAWWQNVGDLVNTTGQNQGWWGGS